MRTLYTVKAIDINDAREGTTLKVGLVYHEKFRQYDLGPSHPFRGDRFSKITCFFEEHGIFRLSQVTMLTPQPVTKQDLLMVHDEKYVDLIFSLAEKSKPYDVEIPVSPQILEAAQLIMGAAIEAGRAIQEGQNNRAVALGNGYNHAGRTYGGGFCLFNDIAMLVEYFRKKTKVHIDFGLRRALRKWNQ